MDSGQEEMIKIKEALKEHPKGLSLSDISRLVNMNRHSIAKYMEMLTISGHVEMRSFGPSKVYFLSQRVPISAMLSFSSDIIGTLDRDMNVVQANDALLKFFGVRREELIGQNINKLGHVLPINSGMTKLLKETLDGKMRQHNIRVDIDGEIRYLRMKLVPSAFDDGTPGVVFLAEDITAEKNAELALKASERRYRAVVEDQTDIICRILPDTTITFVNEAWSRHFGSSVDDVLGKKLADLMSPEGRCLFLAELGSVNAANPSLTTENKIRKRDGSPHWMQFTYRGIFDSTGRKLQEYQIVARDVTERKNAELALEAMNVTLEKKVEERTADLTRSNNMIKTVLDTVPTVVIVTDAATRKITYISPDAIDSLGEDVRGVTMMPRPDGQFLYNIDGSPIDISEWPTTRTLRDGKPVYNGEYLVREKGRNRYFLINCAPAFGPDGSVIAAVTTYTDITERKQAEQVIRESEERFRAVFDRAAVGIAIADPQGFLVDSNLVYQATLGYTKEELQQQRIYDVTHPDDADMCRNFERQLSSGAIDKYQIEKRYVRKDRRIIWGRLSVSAIHSADGSQKYNLGVMEDITERKQAEAALRESEASRKMAEEIAGLGYWDIDLETGKGHWSDITYHILGYRPGDIPTGADAWLSRIHPDDRAYADECKRIALQKMGPMAYDYRIVRPGGEVRWVHDESNLPVVDAKGQPVKVFGTIQDITVRKATEKRLSETTRLLEAALEASPLAINAIDLDTKVLLWNRMAEQVFGWTKEDVLGRPLPTVPEDSKNMNEQLRGMVSSGKSLKGVRISRRRKDGTLIDLTIDASPLYDENGRLLGALGVFQVIKP